jgi:hypothetical protein
MAVSSEEPCDPCVRWFVSFVGALSLSRRSVFWSTASCASWMNRQRTRRIRSASGWNARSIRNMTPFTPGLSLQWLHAAPLVDPNAAKYTTDEVPIGVSMRAWHSEWCRKSPYHTGRLGVNAAGTRMRGYVP